MTETLCQGGKLGPTLRLSSGYSIHKLLLTQAHPRVREKQDSPCLIPYASPSKSGSHCVFAPFRLLLGSQYLERRLHAADLRNVYEGRESIVFL